MHIILNLFQVLLLLIVLVVGVSYIIRKYEVENKKSEAVERRERANLLEAALGVLGEVAAVLITIILYPFGYIPGGASSSRLVPGRKAVILCHGYMHNRSAFFLLAYRLRRAGLRNLIAPNFLPASASVPHFAEILSETVNSAISQTGCDMVDIVGHSMGGLVLRYYIDNLGGETRVKKAVTLGSPNHGTTMAVLGLFASARQFRIDSALIAEMGRSQRSMDSVERIAIWSDFDNIVIPPENAKLPEPAESIRVHGIGHVALLFSNQVFVQLKRVLSEEPAA
jgi:triacylglycerol esterase/lipase EstA (alpha/beta hydrolase family)